MMKLLVFKEKIKEIYSKQSMYILPALKFVITLICMLILNSNIGFMDRINNPIAAILLAAISSILPTGIIVILLSIIILLHIYSLAMELALITFLIMFLMFILYYRFTPKDNYLLILVPVLFFLKIPYIIPLVIGISLTPLSIISMIFGIIMFYIMEFAKVNAVTIANSTTDDGLTKIEALIKGLTGNKEMIIMIVAFALATLLVYFIKRLSVDHSHTIAIITGGITQLLIIIFASFILDINGIDPIWIVAIFSIISIGIAYIIHFFVLTVDYSRTEYTQFEDDEYYYYVKAVPKITVTAPEIKVKHINVQKVK